MTTEEELDKADADAMIGHDRHDAYAANAVLAEELWGALRGLGVERGRMLVLGDHAAVAAGISAKGTVSTSIYEEWVAPIPPAGADGRFPWPHDMLRPRTFTDHDPATHDVVIANVPWSDLHYRSEYGQARLLQIHAQYLMHAIAHTFRGGITAAVVTHRLLDDPESAFRDLLLANSDLLGAARLPATAFRPGLTPEVAAPSDLLLLRRRLPGELANSAAFLDVAPTQMHVGVMYVNEYFVNLFPEHVIGTPAVVTDADLTRYTVHAADEPFDVVLHHVLSRIVRQSLTEGLTAVSASWRPPEARLAAEADRSVRAQGAKAPSGPTTTHRTGPTDAPNL